MADYYRQFHLYFLKGEEGSELENADNLKKKLAELSWSRNLREYCRVMRASCPSAESNELAHTSRSMPATLIHMSLK